MSKAPSSSPNASMTTVLKSCSVAVPGKLRTQTGFCLKHERNMPLVPWKCCWTKLQKQRHFSHYAASHHGAGGEQPSATIAACVELFRSRNLDGLLEFVPDAVIDTCIERVKQKRPETEDVVFRDVLEYSSKDEFQLDAFALRLLVFHQPRAIKVLSSMALGSRFLQRCAVTGATGEEAVLCWELRLQEALEPRYRGVHVRQQWFLKSVTGEPGWQEVATQPSPVLSPELVVETQLEALKCLDVARCFQWASPANKLAIGPVERFRLLLHSPPYLPLLGHHSSQVLKSMQCNATSCMVVAGVTSVERDSGLLQRHVYVWVLTLQEEGGDGWGGCWMTDAVNLLSSYLKRGEEL